MSSTYVSVVIPTLNEERNISKLIGGVESIIRDHPHEIIIVDGYSSDGTVKIAKKMGAKILFDRIGKGSALKTGMMHAKGDIIVAMDADLSHRPNELKLLIAGIEAGYEICMGSRFLTGGGSDDMPAFRKFGNWVFVTLVNIIYGSKYTDLCYGYRSFARGVVKRLSLSEGGFGIETEISIKAQKMHMKVLEIPSYEKKREAGEGKLRSFNDGSVIFRTIARHIMD